MYQTVILTCPDNCQRKGSKNRTNFLHFPQKPAGFTFSVLARPPHTSLCLFPCASRFSLTLAMPLAALHRITVLARCFALALHCVAERLRQHLAVAAALHTGFRSRRASLCACGSKPPERYAPAGLSLPLRFARGPLPLTEPRAATPSGFRAVKCKPTTISLPFSSLFAQHLSTCTHLSVTSRNRVGY